MEILAWLGPAVVLGAMWHLSAKISRLETKIDRLARVEEDVDRLKQDVAVLKSHRTPPPGGRMEAA